MGFLCSCHFVHPEHEVSDPSPLRLHHISKRCYVLHLYWSQSGIGKPSEHYVPCNKHTSFKSFCISCPLFWRGVLQLLNALLENKRQCALKLGKYHAS